MLLGVRVGVLVAALVGVWVALRVAVAVGLPMAVAVWVGVLVGVFVRVEVTVGVLVRLWVHTPPPSTQGLMTKVNFCPALRPPSLHSNWLKWLPVSSCTPTVALAPAPSTVP